MGRISTLKRADMKEAAKLFAGEHAAGINLIAQKRERTLPATVCAAPPTWPAAGSRRRRLNVRPVGQVGPGEFCLRDVDERGGASAPRLRRWNRRGLAELVLPIDVNRKISAQSAVALLAAL